MEAIFLQNVRNHLPDHTATYFSTAQKTSNLAHKILVRKLATTEIYEYVERGMRRGYYLVPYNVREKVTCNEKVNVLCL
jgi:D-aminopeptidase